jgi:hypothetical protein
MSRVSASSRPAGQEAELTGRTKFAVAGAVLGIILLFLLPTWVGIVIIAAAIAVPVGTYLMLDPAQRRRLREIRRRRQIGR